MFPLSCNSQLLLTTKRPAGGWEGRGGSSSGRPPRANERPLPPARNHRRSGRPRSTRGPRCPYMVLHLSAAARHEPQVCTGRSGMSSPAPPFELTVYAPSGIALLVGVLPPDAVLAGALPTGESLLPLFSSASLSSCHLAFVYWPSQRYEHSSVSLWTWLDWLRVPLLLRSGLGYAATWSSHSTA